ncbi:MAG: phospholipase D-like domain-containing protein [Steroidobacteraceae bacterium]
MQPLLRSELALARGFGWRGDLTVAVADATAATAVESNNLELRWLGAGAIRDALLEHLSAAMRGDSIDIASDRLSDRGLIAALLAASRRGATVRLILDPRKSSSLWTVAIRRSAAN